jgi:hypothetical protein
MESEMRKLLFPLSVLLSVVATSVFAAAMTGEIKSVDLRKRLIVMQDDTVFRFPVGIDLTSYKPEHKVRITYETTKSGLNRASAIFHSR